VTVRRDGATSVVVEGDDPQEMADDGALSCSGSWKEEARSGSLGGTVRSSPAAGAGAALSFKGNQVRILGPVGPDGGLADVVIDGKKELTVVDCWSPSPREAQVLYAKSGLTNEKHEIRLSVRGARNPISSGDTVRVDAIQHSAQVGAGDWGAGGGPTGPQRFIMGYPGRKDYADSRGNSWRPGTEFVVRSGYGSDSVAASWWKDRRSIYIGGTPDPELYRYGVHGREFRVQVTVGPGRYRLRLLFADTLTQSIVTVKVNGKEAFRELDIAKEAGGRFKALDRTVEDVAPRNGIIEIRFLGTGDKEASVQAIEVLPCEEGKS
jgi:hypothetical protein